MVLAVYGKVCSLYLQRTLIRSCQINGARGKDDQLAVSQSYYPLHRQSGQATFLLHYNICMTS